MNDRFPDTKLLVYMEGYKAAVAFRALADHEHGDPDFSDGWAAGRLDKMAAYKAASQRYGATLSPLRLANGEVLG